MVHHDSVLVMLVRLVDRLPAPSAPTKRDRGRPVVYADRLFLQALVIMILKHIQTVSGLLSVLAQPTTEMQTLRQVLTGPTGRFPSRRTWERRLARIPASLPAQIGLLGRHLVALIKPWATHGRAVALDSTPLRARGGVWHQKHRAAGEVPHTAIDTEAQWTKSGWHGWVYGWKLHLATTVAGVWIPLAAELTEANVHDSTVAPQVLARLPAEVRVVLGDQHYNTPELHDQCAEDGRLLVTPQRGAYPHTGAGVEVRRLLHALRTRAIELLNEHVKAIFDGHGQVPTKGKVATQRFALGAVLVYQLAVWYRFEHDLDLNVGLKAFLKAA